jgi:hypothetical protein
LPDGQITARASRIPSSPLPKNISVSPSGKSNLRIRASRPDQDGRFAIFAIQHHVLGNPVAELRPAVTDAIGDLIDAFVEFDRDIEPFIGDKPRCCATQIGILK